MQYAETSTDINYSLKRYESENKKWEFGWRQMIFGARFCANPAGAMSYSIEYCGASNKLFNTLLNGLMLQIFELLPESITEREFTNIFPRDSRIKPIYKDAAWHLLSVVQFNHLKLVHGDYTKLNEYGLNFVLNANSGHFKIFSNQSSDIGTITAKKVDSIWLIKEFCISPKYRRLGIGTCLLQKACQTLWDESASPIVLNTEIPENQSLKDWYENMGFAVNQDGLYARQALDYNYGLLRSIIKE